MTAIRTMTRPDSGYFGLLALARINVPYTECSNDSIRLINGAEEEGLVGWWRRLKGPGGLQLL